MRAVISGASRGIGLELTKIALEAGATVAAIARDPRGSSGLGDLAGLHKEKLLLVKSDLNQFTAAEEIAGAIRNWSAVDLLINNAGIMRTGTSGEDFLDSFRVNSIQPFLITKALLPQLKNSGSPKAIHITSLMGSIDDNGSVRLLCLPLIKNCFKHDQ